MDTFLTFLQHHWLLWSGFSIVLFLLITYEFKIRYGGAEKVTAQQAVRLMNQASGVILDIRQEEAYRQGHIQGAINIPLPTLKEGLNKVLRYKDKPIIVVCNIGTVAIQAAKTLIANGFEQCHVLQNGMQGWIDASLPLVKLSKANDRKNKPK